MIKISQAKSLRRDMCRTMGHVETYISRKHGASTTSGYLCSRCKKFNAIVIMTEVSFAGSIPPRMDIQVMLNDVPQKLSDEYKVTWQQI